MCLEMLFRFLFCFALSLCLILGSNFRGGTLVVLFRAHATNVSSLDKFHFCANLKLHKIQNKRKTSENLLILIATKLSSKFQFNFIVHESNYLCRRNINSREKERMEIGFFHLTRNCFLCFKNSKMINPIMRQSTLV